MPTARLNTRVKWALVGKAARDGDLGQRSAQIRLEQLGIVDTTLK